MKTTPLLFNSDMVRALLDGRKTMTRRTVKDDLQEALNFLDDVAIRWGKSINDDGVEDKKEQWLAFNPEYPDEGCIPIGNPYGKIGDLIWVRETWAVNSGYDNLKPSLVIVAMGGDTCMCIDYKATPRNESWVGKVRQSIFMPRDFSRLTLKITDVRVERVQDISDKDAIAEGITLSPSARHSGLWAKAFSLLWEQINGNWDANPWVWVIEFEVFEQNIDDYIQANFILNEVGEPMCLR